MPPHNPPLPTLRTQGLGPGSFAPLPRPRGCLKHSIRAAAPCSPPMERLLLRIGYIFSSPGLRNPESANSHCPVEHGGGERREAGRGRGCRGEEGWGRRWRRNKKGGWSRLGGGACEICDVLALADAQASSPWRSPGLSRLSVGDGGSKAQASSRFRSPWSLPSSRAFLYSEEHLKPLVSVALCPCQKE